MPCSGRLLSAAVLACLAQASEAQRQLVEVTLPNDRPLVRQLSAPPREFVELCTKLRPGTVLDWSFESEAPVAFNTHFHEEGAVKYPEGLSAVTAAKGRLAPGASNDFCWLWSNPGAEPVNIRARITP
jgi:hypothetical protein